MLSPLLLIRLISAIWIAYFIHRQNKNIGWAIIAGLATFAFPIVALPVVLFTRKTVVKPTFKTAPPPELAQLCSKCGHEFKSRTDTCPDCGNNLSISE
jgi:hypothetical protein